MGSSFLFYVPMVCLLILCFAYREAFNSGCFIPAKVHFSRIENLYKRKFLMNNRVKNQGRRKKIATSDFLHALIQCANSQGRMNFPAVQANQN